ncbi:MAG: hypothetical protein NT027_03325, partial [Proteobacteria bacterium]|nr:hypothetical protein [Pseudomonadota bacterium]
HFYKNEALMVTVQNMPKILLIILCLFVCSCSQSDRKLNSVKGLSVEPPKMPVQFETHGFSFSPGRSCVNEWIDPSFCVATEPREWTQTELSKVGTWISSMPIGLLSRVKANGFDSLFRYGHGFRKSADNIGYTRDEPGAWVWGRDKSINVSDLIFAASPLDPFGRYDFSHKTIVHEFAHAFDSGTIDDSFLELIGWRKVDGVWVLSDFDMDEVRATYKRVQKLGFEGLNEHSPQKIAEAIMLNRRYGMERGFPTAYAMTNPSECFAELLSHLIVDPTHREYLSDDILEWFSKNTFYRR